ncbi:MAG: hypothetical protein NC820_05950, partial [Candidatus Omnitrophica bacterium]|nr:hypothetical protein [Candidatus Omnitrophota bacterium]
RLMKDKKKVYSVNLGMHKNQIEFIDNITKEIRFSGGKKPSRAQIVDSFIKIAMKLKVDVRGVKTEKDVEERFFKALKEKNFKTVKNSNEGLL